MVHVLDLRVQGSMAHQVSSLTLHICASRSVSASVSLRLVLPNLGASSIVRILPDAAYMRICGLSFPALGSLTFIRLRRGDVFGYIPHHGNGVDVVELYR